MPNNIVTAGSAVSDTVQQILQRNRDTERQAMLDALSQQNMERNWKHMDSQEALARQQEQRLTEDQAFDQQIQSLPYINDEAPVEGMDPARAAFLRKYGLTTKKPGERTASMMEEQLPEGMYGPPAEVEDPSSVVQQPDQEVYAGSADFRSKQQQEGRIKALRENPEFQQADALTKIIMMREHGIDQNAPGDLFLPEPTVTPISWDGRQLPTIKLPRNGVGMELSRPPAAPRPQYVGVDSGSGRPVNQMPDGSYAVAELPPGVTLGPKPSAASARPQDIVPQQAWGRLAAARGATGLGAANKAARVQQEVDNILAIATDRVSPQAVMNAKEVMADIADFDAAGQPRPSMESIMQDFAGLPKNEYDAIYALLTGLLGNVPLE